MSYHTIDSKTGIINPRHLELEKRPAVMIQKGMTFESKYKLMEELGK